MVEDEFYQIEAPDRSQDTNMNYLRERMNPSVGWMDSNLPNDPATDRMTLLSSYPVSEENPNPAD